MRLNAEILVLIEGVFRNYLQKYLQALQRVQKGSQRMNCYQIMAVRIMNRDESAVAVQKVLTEYGCSIVTRLGLHDQSDHGTCSPSGLLVLQLCSDEATSKALESKLNALNGVKARLTDLS